MKKAWLLILMSFFILNLSFSQDILINEVMPSNESFLQDENGLFPDWIELYNSGTEIINLQGYGLSDDITEPLKWVFPSFNLEPDSYVVVFASGTESTANPQFWETVINKGDQWRYIIPTSQITGWRNTGFNDSSWGIGPSGFGYGDNDDATEVPAGTMSVFLRKEFYITDPGDISKILLHIDYDDGFVAYINGHEVCRAGIGQPGIIPNYNEATPDYTEPRMITGLDPFGFEVSDIVSILNQGENILAIQVHNNSTGSSDLTLIPYMSMVSSQRPSQPPVKLPGISISNIHTNFKLDADKESVFLVSPESILIDSLQFLQIPPNMSTGIANGTADIVLFDTPTPGAMNAETSFSGIITEMPTFSHQSGFHSLLFKLELQSANPDDSIFYTTDGTIPNNSSKLYASSGINITGSKVITARIIKEGYIPGPIVTNTYVEGKKPSMPAIFLATNPMNLWDFNEGIYVMGPGAEEASPHFGANFWMDWEKPVHVEMLETDGSSAFSIDAGMKIFGNYSRAHAMKSVAIFARAEYGYKNIPYRLFPEKNIEKFESFVLRNSGNDWHGAGAESGILMRDALTGSLIDDLGIDHQATRQTVVYINGTYWGIHNMREKINEHFLADNHSNLDPDKVDILESNAVVVEGSNLHYNNMINYLVNNDIKQASHYDYIRTQMDIENFIDFNIVNIYIYNGDWPGNNIKFWRSQSEDGKWRWILFDTDFGFGIWDASKVNNNTLIFATSPNGPGWPNPPWSTYLLRRLLENDDFRDQFINTFADRLNTIYQPTNIREKISYLLDNIKEELPYHFTRWGGNADQYNYNIIEVRNFADRRKAIMEDYITSFFQLADHHEITINSNNSSGGIIKVNTLKTSSFPWKGTYYESVGLKVHAFPAPGYDFKGWTGTVINDSPELEITLTNDTYLTAIFEVSQTDYPIVINEISYKGSETADAEDWVELYNNTTQQRDISGWIFKDNDDLHGFVIAENTVMEPGGFLVLLRDLNTFRTFFPNVNPVLGEFDFGLSSDGEFIRLYDQQMTLMDSVNYGISDPWPAANGTGFTLSLIDPDWDNSLPESWAASSQLGGTPGSENGLPDGIEDELNIAAESLKLYNYPNPFSQQTTVKIYNNKYQQFRLSIYDLNGRQLQIITEEYQPEGSYSFNLNAENLPEGVLIIRLETDESVINKKVLHVR